jgi:ribosomal protein L11 methyltransferase
MRFTLRAPRAEADAALVRMLEWFPEGVEQEDGEEAVLVAGYAEAQPVDAWGLEAEPVEDGWRDRWRAYHHPVRAGRLWVGPPWHEPDPGSLAIVIDPGHAFGTGAHGSTRAALELLQGLPPSPFLDLGCGSGVLAIAALRLGFGPAAGFDLDPLALAAAAENARRNGVQIELRPADVLRDPLPPAPLWLANLQHDLLERLLRREDLPPAIVASGLVASETLGGAPRAVVDGWAAEVLGP